MAHHDALQAVDYQASSFQCTFTRRLVLDAAETVRKTQGMLHKVGHTPRRFTGYMLECEDPGSEYNYFTFASGTLILKSVKITTIETEEAGVGICVASLYSHRVGFENWVKSLLHAGFSKIYVYYTHVTDPTALNPHYGTEQVRGQFLPENLPNVQYFYFQAPAQTWTFAQSTMSTECIHRNRVRHPFLAMIDADEFFWRPPSNESLLAFFTRLIPDDTASLIFPDIMYPEPCQGKRSCARGVDPVSASHFYYPTAKDTQPKSVVMPTRSLIHRVHHLAAAEPGYTCCFNMLPYIGYWKHVRQRGGGCSAQDRSALVDDTDVSSFQQIMYNTSLWTLS